MTKLPPYQPTAQQMQAQAQAARMAQQQAYLQSQMTMYPLSPQPFGAANNRQQQLANQQTAQTTGGQHGGYWYSGTPTSSSSTNTAYIANLGASGTLVYTSGAVATCQPIPAPTIEEAGIRAGEITGYRAWYLRSEDELWSVYMPYVWKPGVQRIVDERVNRHMGNGFHAFKDMDQCRREYPGPGIVYGEVALWGEVYEHERGYRAEYARITRIIEVNEDSEPPWIRFWRRPTIHKLRSKYGVVE